MASLNVKTLNVNNSHFLFCIWTRASVCQVRLTKPIRMSLISDNHTCLIAQLFPYFGKVSLRNKCVLTCNGQRDGLGGILAFRANTLSIDETSKIDMSGKGNCNLLSSLSTAFQPPVTVELNTRLI